MVLAGFGWFQGVAGSLLFRHGLRDMNFTKINDLYVSELEFAMRKP